jgi:hypothetical protein
VGNFFVSFWSQFTAVANQRLTFIFCPNTKTNFKLIPDMDALDQIFQFTQDWFFGCQYSYFENWCPKPDTGTPEDMAPKNFRANPSILLWNVTTSDYKVHMWHCSVKFLWNDTASDYKVQMWHCSVKFSHNVTPQTTKSKCGTLPLNFLAMLLALTTKSKCGTVPLNFLTMLLLRLQSPNVAPFR